MADFLIERDTATRGDRWDKGRECCTMKFYCDCTDEKEKRGLEALRFMIFEIPWSDQRVLEDSTQMKIQLSYHAHFQSGRTCCCIRRIPSVIPSAASLKPIKLRLMTSVPGLSRDLFSSTVMDLLSPNKNNCSLTILQLQPEMLPR